METLTKNAAVDSLSDQDYMEILEELLQTHTLRELADVLHSDYSFAYWSKVKRGESPLHRKGKNELRAAMKLPLLPPTIIEAVAVMDENGEVRRIGTEAPDLIYMLNHAETGEMAPVTAVTSSAATGQRKNERVFNMSRGVLAWKIAHREEYSVA